jgi:glycosyltransferase involved in cell wall biosynthesis
LRDVQKNSFGSEDAIYTTFVNSDIPAMRALKEKGVRIIHERILSPDIGLVRHQECTLFPGVEEQIGEEEILFGLNLDKEKHELADLIIVGSDRTRNVIGALGWEQEKVFVIPYGLDVDDWRDADPIPGRVLFVGSVSLLKGGHYFAAACREIKRRGIRADFVAAGPYDNRAVAHPCFFGPKYLGQIPRGEIRREFRRADIFVLPTLSDSFAMSHLEALASGLPVITTTTCGAMVRDGVEGFIVPPRDIQSLANRIEELILDRALRQRMSAAALKLSSEFTPTLYGQRLVSVIDGVLKKTPATIGSRPEPNAC